MSRTNAAVPFYSEGKEFTCHCGAAVTGKRFVAVSGNQIDERPVVSHAGAGAVVLGVSGYDAALGAGVTVYRKGNVMPVTAGAALTAGQQVQSDANGQAIPLASGVAAGIALADAANGTEAKIALV
jgi:hypothetical protein